MQLVDIKHSMDQAIYPDLTTLQEKYGWDRRTHRVFDRLFDLKSTSLHPELSLQEGLMVSAKHLAADNPDLMGNVDYIVYCHAVNMVLRHDDDCLTRIAHEAFNSDAEVMSVTMGSCASAIMAMEYLADMIGDDTANVVFLTGEKCFFTLLDYVENNGLFGEVTTATYMRTGTTGGTRIKATAAGRFEGVFTCLASATKEELAAYDHAYIPTMSAAVETALQRAEVMPQDIGLVLPTHLSPFTFNRVAASVGIGADKVLKQNLHTIGHCFCGDLFINLATLSKDFETTGHPQNVMSFAAGMTGSYAAVILSRESTS